MIVFRQTDPTYPFLWEDRMQPSGRWHQPGDGPAHYFCDTPDGAWAEFLRHQDIREAMDLPGVRRTLWAVDLPAGEKFARPALSESISTGDTETYPNCREEARRLRAAGKEALIAASAALIPGKANGWKVNAGLKPGPYRSGKVFVLFGRRPDLIGWAAVRRGYPSEDLLLKVNYFSRRRYLPI